MSLYEETLQMYQQDVFMHKTLTNESKHCETTSFLSSPYPITVAPDYFAKIVGIVKYDYTVHDMPANLLQILPSEQQKYSLSEEVANAYLTELQQLPTPTNCIGKVFASNARHDNSLISLPSSTFISYSPLGFLLEFALLDLQNYTYNLGIHHNLRDFDSTCDRNIYLPESNNTILSGHIAFLNPLYITENSPKAFMVLDKVPNDALKLQNQGLNQVERNLLKIFQETGIAFLTANNYDPQLVFVR